MTFDFRIEKIKDAEKAVIRKAAVRNNLEANLYRLKDLVEKPSFVEISQDQERQIINALIVKSSEMLDNDEEKIDMGDFQKMLDDLLAPEKAINSRLQEHERRPSLVLKLRDQIAYSKDYASRIKSEFSDPTSRAQTDEDLASLNSKAIEVEKWLEESEIKQKKLPATHDPILWCSAVESRVRELAQHHHTISSKKLPPPPQPPVSPTSGAADLSPENSTLEADKGESPVEPTVEPIEPPMTEPQEKDEKMEL